MKITFDAKPAKSDALVVFTGVDGKPGDAARKLDTKSKGAIKRMLAAEKFAGKKGQIIALPAPGGFAGSHVVMVALADNMTGADFEKIGSQLVGTLNARKIAAAAVAVDFSGLKMKLVDPAEAAALRSSALRPYRSYRRARTDGQSHAPRRSRPSHRPRASAQPRATTSPRRPLPRRPG